MHEYNVRKRAPTTEIAAQARRKRRRGSELMVSQAETLPITALIYLGPDRFLGRAPVLSAEGSAD